MESTTNHRGSLEEHGVGEKEIMLYDQIAVEKHDYTATKAERIRNSQHWVLSINVEGPQLPGQQRPDYAAAKRECQRLQDAKMAETKQLYKPIHPSKQMRQNPNQQFEEVKIMTTLLIGKQDGNGFKSNRETCRILRLRRPHHGRIPHGKIGINGGGILQNLTKSSE